jgi:hypothetical protein
MLDSDVNNADAQLHAEFYTKEDGPRKRQSLCAHHGPG